MTVNSVFKICLQEKLAEEEKKLAEAKRLAEEKKVAEDKKKEEEKLEKKGSQSKKIDYRLEAEKVLNFTPMKGKKGGFYMFRFLSVIYQCTVSWEGQN